MMKIHLVLDEEGGIDPIDLIGEISINNGSAVILEKCTYLDSWLYALLSGFREVQAGKRISVDLVEEPDPLIFEPQNRGLRLTYKDTTVFVDSVDEYGRALRRAAEDFLCKLGSVKGANNNLLNLIRNSVLQLDNNKEGHQR